MSERGALIDSATGEHLGPATPQIWRAWAEHAAVSCWHGYTPYRPGMKHSLHRIYIKSGPRLAGMRDVEALRLEQLGGGTARSPARGLCPDGLPRTRPT